jgi:hypothetical protein
MAAQTKRFPHWSAMKTPQMETHGDVQGKRNAAMS